MNGDGRARPPLTSQIDFVIASEPFHALRPSSWIAGCRRSAVSDHRNRQLNIAQLSVVTEASGQLTNAQYAHVHESTMFRPRRIGLCARFCRLVWIVVA
jgi:hypothetical protein